MKTYDGSFDAIIDGYLEGWAINRSRPDVPATIALYVDRVFVQHILCDLFRSDLAQAGIGLGFHAFRIPIPPQYRDGNPHLIDLCFEQSHSLPNSPRPYQFSESLHAEPVTGTSPEGPINWDFPDAALQAVPDSETVIQQIAHLFDRSFYLRTYPEIAELSVDPLEHYIAVGWQEGRDPSAGFSTRYYIENNPDIREAGINPFWHYVTAGRKEGRSAQPADSSADIRTVIEPEFDEAYYLERYPDIKDGYIAPLEHFLTAGWRERRNPNAEFSTGYYLDNNPDIREAGINPFWHFIVAGRMEGRPGKPSDLSSDVFAMIGAEFDAAYYLEQNPDIRTGGVDPLEHFIMAGWRERRDPNPHFSISYYLETYPDIREADINPFWHYITAGRIEGRTPLSFADRKRRQPYAPLVSVIVPNYNHARFLPQRLDCILSQTYPNLEIIVLDDASSDNSADVIKKYAKKHSKRLRALLNKENSGGVFNQWQKGIEAATGELIWICESDDFCETDFLEKVVPQFVDESIMIAFGRIQFANAQGKLQDGLDGYREQTEAGIWNDPVIRTAHEWFNTAFGVSNIIPNVGGCVIRKQPIPDTVWAEAKTYKILGDWYLYAMLSGGGRMAYIPDAVTYFRQHGKNTSVKSFQTSYYYTEHKRIIDCLRERWGTSNEIALRFFGKVYDQFEYANARHSLGDLLPLFNIENTLRKRKRSTHILICSLGFHLGGGEIFPIHLANELVNRDYIVSFLILDPNNSEERIRKQLDTRIAIYETQFVKEMGIERFIREAGVDLIHSHVVGMEFFFFGEGMPAFDLPYIVTLHGSYEVTPVPDDMLERITSYVSRWVYLTPKNLNHLAAFPSAKRKATFIANGMPIDKRPFDTRKSLGFDKNDIVFTVVSRAIPEKGWRFAVQALKAAQKKTDRTLRLLFCGSGPEADYIQEKYGNDPAIKLMGFQDRIHGAYAISDCALLPTRFLGESFPLTLIQAMQVGKPVIATAVGEIDNMVFSGTLKAGITIGMTEDDKEFVKRLTKAMLMMVDDAFRATRAADAEQLGKQYAISNVTEKYIEIYHQELHDEESHPVTLQFGT